MRLPFRSLATTLLAIGVATCSDTPIASVKNGATPAKSSLARVAFGASFSKSASLIESQLAASGNGFDNVHLSLRDLHDTTVVVKDTTFAFSATGPDSAVVTLDVPVQTDGQEFNAGLDFQRGSVVLFHGSVTVHSFLPGSTPPTPPTITAEYVGPGKDATRLALAPQSVTLDQSTGVTFSVTAFNESNAQVETPPISWSVSDPTIASITSSGTISGRGRRGTVVVTATFKSASGQASASFTLPPAAIAVVSGAGQTGHAGSTLPSPAVVQVTTSDGVGVGGASVVFGAPAGGSVSPATAVTDANGRASTNLTLGSAAGPQSFVATAAGFSAAIGETATANVASAIAIVAGNNQTDSIRKVLAPLSVKVSDQFGNPVAGASVSWTRASGTGALGSASSTSGADGVATNIYTLGNVPGAESVTASVGSTPAASVVFSFTTRAGGAAAIVPVGGDAQTVRAGEAVASPLVVRVTDAATNPVAGATVTWTATAGTVAPATSTTDATGQASATFTAGLATGQGFAVAHLGNAIVNFTLTIRPGATTQLAFTTQPINGNAGAALAPVVVTLRDAGGNTVTTSSDPVTIALGANTAGATLSGTLTRNAVNGVATFNDLRLDKVGTAFTLVATSGAFHATSNAFNTVLGTAARIQIVGPTSLSFVAGTTTTSIPSFLVTDASGNPVPNFSFQLSLAEIVKGVALTQGDSTVTTDGTGQVSLASLVLKASQAGSYVLTATATGLTGSPITLPVTVAPGAPAALVFTPGPSSATAAAVMSPVTVSITDTFGNVIPGATNSVTLTLSQNTVSGTLSGTLTRNAVNGVATFSNLSIDRSSPSYQMTASATGLQSAVSQPFGITTSAATHLAILAQPPTSTVAGATLPTIRVALEDAGNNVVPASDAITLTLAPNPGSATLGGTTTQAAQNGIATFTGLTVDKAGIGYGILASVVGSTTIQPASTNSFTVTAGGVATLTVVGGDNQVATVNTAVVTSPSVRVTDAANNPLAGIAVTFVIASGNGSISPAGGVVTTNALGVATLSSWTLGVTAGAQTLVASSAGVPSVTLHATAQPANAFKLAFTSGPTSAAAAAVMSPVTVSITDTFGNVVPTATNSVTIALAPNTFAGVLSGTTTAAAINGVATFNNLSVDRVGGSYQLTASATGLLTAQSQPFGIASSVATHLAILAQPPTSIVAGASLTTISVAMEDAGNNVVPATNSITLTLAPNPGSATLGGTTTQAAQNGVATFNGLTVDKAGIGYGILASVVGSTTILPASTNSFTVTSNAPTKMVFLTPPSNVVAGAVETPSVVVQLQDASGNLASGATNIVSLNIVSGPGTTINGGTVQAVNGVAVFTSASFPVAGTYVVSALSGSLTPPTSVTINVTAGGVATLVPSSLQTVIAQAGSALTSAPTVTAKDGSGNPIPGTAITVTVRMAGSGNLALGVTPTVLTTNAQGMIALNDLPVSALPTVMLSYLLELSDGGAPFVDVPLAITAATASKIVLVTPLPTTVTSGAPSLQTPTFLIEDTYGNSVAASRIVTASVPLTSGVTLSGNTADTTSVGGVGSFTGLVVTGPSGPVTLTFNSGTLTPGVWTPTIVQPAAASLALIDSASRAVLSTAPISMTAGQAPSSPPLVLAKNATGGPVSNVVLGVQVAGHRTPTFGGSIVTRADGTASFVVPQLVAADTVADTLSVVIGQAGPPAISIPGTLIINPATPARLVFGPAPTGATTGTATSITVSIADRFNNVEASASDSITLTAVGPGVMTGGGARTSTSVVHITGVQFSVAGTYTISALSTSGLPSVTPLTVVVASDATLPVSSLELAGLPSNVANNSTFTASVQLKSGTTNVPRAGVVVTATIVSPAGTVGNGRLRRPTLPPGPAEPMYLLPPSLPVLLAGTSTTVTATTDASGVATFTNLRAVGTTQSFALSFSTSGLTPDRSVTSTDISLGAGVGYGITSYSGDGQSGAINAALPAGLRVQLVDTSSNPTTAPAATVYFSVLTGGGSVSPTAGTDENGQATATWTLGALAGAQTMKASTTIGGVTTSATFTATAQGAQAMIFSQNPSTTAAIGTVLTSQPWVQLTDVSGNPVMLAGVTITASVGDAPGGPYDVIGTLALTGTQTATTNASGIAKFTNLAITGIIRPARLTFSSASLTSLTSDVTLSAGAPYSMANNSSQVVSTAVGVALGDGQFPSVKIKDASGNGVANSSAVVTYSIQSGSCTITGSPTPAVDALGLSSLSSSSLSIPNAAAGSCVVRAASPGLSGSPFDFTVIVAASSGLTWLGTTNADFSTASNWRYASAFTTPTVPTISDAIFIPKSTPHTPQLQADGSVASITMEAGSNLDINSANTLTVAGTATVLGTITHGTVVLNATSGTVQGTFPALTFGDGTSSCSYLFQGNVTTAGNARFSNCTVDVSSNKFAITGTFDVSGANGNLTMQNASGHVTVSGAATFEGGTSLGLLTNGLLEVAGDFTQTGTYSANSFSASGSHLTRLYGTAAQAVNFANGSSSYFNDLDVTNASTNGATIGGITTVGRNLTAGSGARVKGSGAGKRLIVNGTVTTSATADLGGLDSLRVTGTTFPVYSNTTAGKAPKVTQLTGAVSLLSGTRTVAGGLSIGSTLTINGGTLVVSDSFSIDGGSVSALAGILEVGSNFTEAGSTTAAFQPAAGFLTELNGTSGQTVTFNHSQSYFQDLQIQNTSASGVTLNTDATINGSLEQKGILNIPVGRTGTVIGPSNFRSGAVTTVNGTLALSSANFYNGSTTTGTGGLTVTSCQYGSLIGGASLLVGTFNVTSCMRGNLP